MQQQGRRRERPALTKERDEVYQELFVAQSCGGANMLEKKYDASKDTGHNVWTHRICTFLLPLGTLVGT